VLRCDGCGCASDDGAGWVGFLAEDPDGADEPSVLIVCPPCAAERFEYEAHVRYT
jgi:hypothetical protein